MRVILFLTAFGAASAASIAAADPWDYGYGRYGAWDYGLGRAAPFGTGVRTYGYWGGGSLGNNNDLQLRQQLNLRHSLNERWYRRQSDLQQSYNRYYGLPSYGYQPYGYRNWHWRY
jgi:hypothetical protein